MSVSNKCLSTECHVNWRLQPKKITEGGLIHSTNYFKVLHWEIHYSVNFHVSAFLCFVLFGVTSASQQLLQLKQQLAGFYPFSYPFWLFCSIFIFRPTVLTISLIILFFTHHFTDSVSFSNEILLSASSMCAALSLNLRFFFQFTLRYLFSYSRSSVITATSLVEIALSVESGLLSSSNYVLQQCCEPVVYP